MSAWSLAFLLCRVLVSLALIACCVYFVQRLSIVHCGHNYGTPVTSRPGVGIFSLRQWWVWHHHHQVWHQSSQQSPDKNAYNSNMAFSIGCWHNSTFHRFINIICESSGFPVVGPSIPVPCVSVLLCGMTSDRCVRLTNLLHHLLRMLGAWCPEVKSDKGYSRYLPSLMPSSTAVWHE